MGLQPRNANPKAKMKKKGNKTEDDSAQVKTFKN